ncbi:hypothetical protein XvhCFBP2543_22650 [Xanthomonas vasicola]|nr:hypothetical protein NX79_08980 [Xanthomonas vasicola]KNX93470.1 hypothetical protein NX05_24045 [Xanthomonas vasicola]PPU99097.1 hypothetical protein XvhCFBP2543_22650 [Xanthomonas vasicola]
MKVLFVRCYLSTSNIPSLFTYICCQQELDSNILNHHFASVAPLLAWLHLYLPTIKEVLEILWISCHTKHSTLLDICREIAVQLMSEMLTGWGCARSFGYLDR